jgi:hypothetical protein
MLLSADCGSASEHWNPDLPNDCVMLLKNDPRVREIVAEWDLVTDKDEETRWSWPPTQRAIWYHVLPKYKDDIHIVRDYYCVHGRWGQFIRHFYLSSDEDRCNRMKTIYSRLTLSHADAANQRPVIKVVQYQWGKENHSYAVNQKINEAYCRRHGYEYVVKTFVPRDDRSPHWAKIPAMREELHDCDFLLFMDADAFFYSHELTIDNELVPLLENKQIMMSADDASEGIRHQLDKPNSGVILVRNSEKTAEFLRAWDETSERPGLEEFRFNLFREKETCFRTVWQEYADDVKLLKDYYLMNGFHGMFIRHLMDMKDEERRTIQEEFLKSRQEFIPVF